MRGCNDVALSTLLNARIKRIYLLFVTLEYGIPASITLRIIVKGLRRRADDDHLQGGYDQSIAYEQLGTDCLTSLKMREC